MNSWKEKRFTDCILLNPSIKLENDSEYSFIEMADLGPENKYATPKRYRKPIGLTKFQEGDTLFAKITPCLENGNICQATKLDNGIGVGSTEFFVFRGKEGVIHNEFVYYLLRSYPIKEYAIRNMTGSAGQQRVPTDIFKTLVIPLPEYEESKRIGQFLSLFDRKISLLRRQNEILEEMAQALFRHWFIDFEFPISKEYAESIGKPELEGKPYRSSGGVMRQGEVETCGEREIPVNWQCLQLRNIAKFSNGKTSPERFYTGRFSVYGSNGIIGYSEVFNSIKDTIIIGRVGSYCGSLFYSQNECWVTDNAIMCNSQKLGETSFLFYFLKQQNLNKLSSGSGQPLINQSILNNIEMSMPSDLLITEYCNRASLLLQKQCLNNMQIEKMIKLRDTLLPKLMSGEVKV